MFRFGFGFTSDCGVMDGRGTVENGTRYPVMSNFIMNFGLLLSFPGGKILAWFLMCSQSFTSEIK